MNKAYWQYRAVYTNLSSVAGSIVITFSPGIGNVLLLENLMLGNDDYAAGRALTIHIVDAANNIIGKVVTSSALDNVTIQARTVGTAASNSNNLIDLTKPYPIIGTDKIYISGAALAQDETLTVAIRGELLGGTKPSIVTTGGTIKNDDLSVSTTYDKVNN